MSADPAAISTSGIEMTRGSRLAREAVELVSSMRFAISLLTVICIASVIGTVLQQGQPATSYINQFGPFWYEVFARMSLYSVYSAWWFLLILAFLVISTSLCIARNAPKILADLRTFKEHVREQSLHAFHHKAYADLAEGREQAVQRIGQHLLAKGYKLKLDDRSTAERGATLIAGKAGSANKLGYLAAHGAIVLVCIGGMLDGDMGMRIYMWLTDRQPTRDNMLIAQTPPAHRMPVGNPSYRGNVFVPEGGLAQHAILNFSSGVMVQDLPVAIKLNKFIVEYYSTGMPKLFASDVEVTDLSNGQVHKGRVEVNKPMIVNGLAIYQSSFDDGGSQLKFTAWPMQGASARTFAIDGMVGSQTKLQSGNQQLGLEFTGLRVINVENTAKANATDDGGVDVRKVDLGESIKTMTGAGVNLERNKDLRNVGPSVTYKLRDASGQAREFSNYMLPMELEGTRVFLAGIRDNPNEPFRYVRIPADENDEVKGFMILRAALSDARLRAQAVERYAAEAAGEGASSAQSREQLMFSVARALDLYSGAIAVPAAKPGQSEVRGGLQAIAQFLENAVPEAERDNASAVFLRLLSGVTWQLYQVARAQQGLPPAPVNEAGQRFMTQALLALSDSFVYGAPVYLKLDDFTHVQASVFQVARAPGRYLVYLGCGLLILGVFAMLYVRERRIWVLVKDAQQAGPGSEALMALSTTRKTMEFEEEYRQIAAHINTSNGTILKGV
jgi:cytochrome c biogenesis protein